MNKRIGKGTLLFSSPVKIYNYDVTVGQKEKEGPLGEYFKYYSNDEYFGQPSFEKAESFMQKEVLRRVIQSKGLSEQDIDFVFAGDLLNQCVGSGYCVRDTDVQYFGLYGACSTMAESIIAASMAIDGGFAERAVAMTSSHFCSAERQFRFPLEYGAQRPPSAQWTVTGAGAVLLNREFGNIFVKQCRPGKILDFGVKDTSNMGAAMAPAAEDTLFGFFKDTSTTPEDYDLIVTGDLGAVGSELLRKLLQREGVSLGRNYNDCGLMIYDPKTQDVHSGGSGCGCSASVLTGYILPQMEKKIYKNVLFIATGALMSPTVSMQGESIPGIAHLVNFVRA